MAADGMDNAHEEHSVTWFTPDRPVNGGTVYARAEEYDESTASDGDV